MRPLIPDRIRTITHGVPSAVGSTIPVPGRKKYGVSAATWVSIVPPPPRRQMGPTPVLAAQSRETSDCQTDNLTWWHNEQISPVFPHQTTRKCSVSLDTSPQSSSSIPHNNDNNGFSTPAVCCFFRHPKRFSFTFQNFSNLLGGRLGGHELPTHACRVHKTPSARPAHFCPGFARLFMKSGEDALSPPPRKLSGSFNNAVPDLHQLGEYEKNLWDSQGPSSSPRTFQHAQIRAREHFDDSAPFSVCGIGIDCQHTLPLPAHDCVLAAITIHCTHKYCKRVDRSALHGQNSHLVKPKRSKAM